ncbi:MAG: HEAT repeat domain-containing protein [Planctomycetota bacterium]
MAETSKRIVRRPTSTAKKTARQPTPQGPLLSTKQKIAAGVVAAVVLAVALGYSSFLQYWYTSTLDTAPDLGARKAAAEALFEHWGVEILYIFRERVDRPDPLTSEAAAYGMELVARKTTSYQQVIEKFKDVLPGAEAPRKLIFIRALANITGALLDTRGQDKPSQEQAENQGRAVKTAAEALIPCAEAKEQNMEVRLAAVGVLAELRAEGVCKELLKLAGTETGPLREKARNGIAATALPDALPELLAAMTGPDKELAAVSRQAFTRVRDAAPSSQLLPLVSHPMEEVRREIIAALGKRRGDEQARKGITAALDDKLPELRILALKSVPCTGLSGSMEKLDALVKDSDENVRLATAETLGQLGDQDSKTVLLKAFKNGLQGKTLEAFVAALGKRSSGKSLPEVAIVMPLLDSNPAAENSIHEALVLLTMNGNPERATQRRSWDAARWKAWWAKITEREKMKDEAVAQIEKIKAQGKQQDRLTYPQLKDALEKQLDVLELCKEKCKPDDTEDISGFDTMLTNYTKVKDFFIKGASYDFRK